MVHNLKMHCGCLNSVLQNIRNFSGSATFLSKNNRNHYDSLKLTPKATQAEVKTAYYKLSMQYHPDRNAGSEAASEQFRDISAAYEVLGNVKLRKLYDKGLYDSTPKSPSHPEDRTMEFYRSRERRTRPPPPDGRTPIYDFDEWSKQHYGATFAKKMKQQQKLRRAEVINEMYSARKKQDGFFLILVITAALVLFASSVFDDYDRPKEIHKTSKRT